MTCYCDIPLDDLPFHASKYGRFGLGFPRDFLIDRGARPVSYFPLRADDWRGIRGATVLKDIESIYRAFHDRLLTPTRERNPGRHPRGVGNAPESDDAAIEQINAVLTMHFLGYLKPYDSLLQQDHPDYYYAEREWRSTIYQRFIPDEV